jgi:hypothetical protein
MQGFFFVKLTTEERDPAKRESNPSSVQFVENLSG